MVLKNFQLKKKLKNSYFKYKRYYGRTNWWYRHKNIDNKYIKLSAEEGKEFKLKKCLDDELGMNLFVGIKYKPK